MVDMVWCSTKRTLLCRILAATFKLQEQIRRDRHPSLLLKTQVTTSSTSTTLSGFLFRFRPAGFFALAKSFSPGRLIFLGRPLFFLGPKRDFIAFILRRLQAFCFRAAAVARRASVGPPRGVEGGRRRRSRRHGLTQYALDSMFLHSGVFFVPHATHSSLAWPSASPPGTMDTTSRFWRVIAS